MSTSQLGNNQIYIDPSVGYLNINLMLNSKNNKFTQTILMDSDNGNNTICVCCDTYSDYNCECHSEEDNDRNMMPILCDEHDIGQNQQPISNTVTHECIYNEPIINCIDFKSCAIDDKLFLNFFDLNIDMRLTIDMDNELLNFVHNINSETSNISKN